MKYQITHKTSYTYTELVPVCHNLVHLAPRATPHQKCIDYRLEIYSVSLFISNRGDYFGNRTEYFSIEGGHQKLEITAESIVDVSANASQASGESLAWEECTPKRMVAGVKDRTREAPDPVLSLLSFPSPRIPIVAGLREYAESSFTPRRPILECLTELTKRIHNDFKFDSRATSVD